MASMFVFTVKEKKKLTMKNRMKKHLTVYETFDKCGDGIIKSVSLDGINYTIEAFLCVNKPTCSICKIIVSPDTAFMQGDKPVCVECHINHYIKQDENASMGSR